MKPLTAQIRARLTAYIKSRLRKKSCGMRKGKKPCPFCEFEWIVATNPKKPNLRKWQGTVQMIEKYGMVWCAACGLMMPNNIRNINTGRRLTL
jgi:transcription elongation factor Elf1